MESDEFDVCGNLQLQRHSAHWNMQMSGTQLLFGVQLAFRMQRHKNECELSDIELVSLRWVVVRTFGSIDVSKSRIKPD